jgi:hypothetical protein
VIGQRAATNPTANWMIGQWTATNAATYGVVAQGAATNTATYWVITKNLLEHVCFSFLRIDLYAF